jgi:hypothetical protein
LPLSLTSEKAVSSAKRYNISTTAKALSRRLIISSDDEESEVPVPAFLSPTPRLPGDEMEERRGAFKRLKFTRSTWRESEELEPLKFHETIPGS